MANSLQPHGLQQARLPCPSLSPGVCSDSYSLSQWCHPTISSSAISSSCLQSFPASGCFPVSPLFPSGGQSVGSSLLHQSFQWILGLISFRIDWLDLFANCANLESFLPITFLWFPGISRLPLLCYLPPTYPLEMVEWWNVLFNCLPGTKSKGKRCVCSWM